MPLVLPPKKTGECYESSTETWRRTSSLRLFLTGRCRAVGNIRKSRAPFRTAEGWRVSRDCSIQLPSRRQLVKECAHSRLGLDVDKLARQSMIRRVRKGDVKYACKVTNSPT